MAKEEKKEESNKSDPRQEKWDAIWEAYKKQNPTKYAYKRSTVDVDGKPKKDEYLEIPENFK